MTVSPGDNIFPRLTAQWYNNTLRPHPRATKQSATISLPREGELYCVVDGATIERFHPCGVDTAIDTTYDNQERIFKLTEPDEWNWAITQEEGPDGGTVLTVISGITRAFVKIDDPSHHCVVWSPYQNRLITARQGKAQLLVPGDTEGDTTPALINIGVQENCVSLIGRVAEGLEPTCNSVEVTSLRGINFYTDSLTTIQAKNLFTFEADPDSWVKCEWVMEAKQWVITQATCPGSDICSFAKDV